MNVITKLIIYVIVCTFKYFFCIVKKKKKKNQHLYVKFYEY